MLTIHQYRVRRMKTPKVIKEERWIIDHYQSLDKDGYIDGYDGKWQLVHSNVLGTPFVDKKMADAVAEKFNELGQLDIAWRF